MSQEKVAKPTGRCPVSGEGRQEKMYRRHSYDYAFKLKVINYYATAGISATISRFFSITDDGPKGSKRKLLFKWKQQRAQIEHRAGTAATHGHQRSRDRGLATTLPQSA
uniref:AlNc14C2G220 protein n=1 Tax=Albugo laibachii Nc14 TaxID=890382 RepID=F0VZN7_9STRA|nr:AlNc14C2G220 [Albugo laibachii Nc14]|eukprot:CCA14109.1 AlNc14C2G220 [Albugo laibachii Nc14]